MSAPVPYWSDGQVTLHLGDCLEVLAAMEAASVDAVCTDPPYGLEFMGKEWDRFSGAVTDRDFKGFVLSQQRTRNVKCPDCGKWAYDHPGRLCECGGIRRAQGSAFQQWCEQWAAECLRVLKPGGHLLAFGGTRTWHRLACAIEDAGFEIRDSVADLTGIDGPGLLWLYGSGFPKSLDVSKAIDRHLGAQRPVVDVIPDRWAGKGDVLQRATQSERADALVTTSATAAAAAAAEGWGTALKPAWEPVVVGRKPLAGTVAANVLEYGTGALNVDGCRVNAGSRPLRVSDRRSGNNTYSDGLYGSLAAGETSAGRWPPNVLLGEEAAAELDRQSGHMEGGNRPARRGGIGYGSGAGGTNNGVTISYDSGGASRFFPVFRYEAKAGSAERPRVKNTLLRLRADLTEDERAYVMAELRKAGVDAA